MAYDDIRKELASWIDFLRHIKKDISSGQTRNYGNVLNALNRLGKAIRSVEKISDNQDDEAIRRRCGDIKKSVTELQNIISDSISKPDSWIKVTNRLNDLIDDFEALSESLAEGEEKSKLAGGGKADLPNGKRIPYWIYILTLFFAALLTCLFYLGCLEPIKAFISKILLNK
jgi:hypothetical protein